MDKHDDRNVVDNEGAFFMQTKNLIACNGGCKFFLNLQWLYDMTIDFVRIRDICICMYIYIYQ